MMSKCDKPAEKYRLLSRRDFIALGGAGLAGMAVHYIDAAPVDYGVLNPFRKTTSDLRPFMQHGINHIYNGAIDSRYHFMPFVRFNLTEPPTWAKHIEWGCPHMVGRFVDALAVCAAVMPVPVNEEAVGAFREYLHTTLDNPFTMPFHITLDSYPKTAEDGWIHNCREVLLGLIGLAQWRNDTDSENLAKKFVRVIDDVTRSEGHFPSGSIGINGWGTFAEDQLNMCSGRLIRALLHYYRHTGDDLGVTLAERFAKTNIASTFTPDGRLTEASGNHLHSTQGTMTGIINLGMLAGNTEYVELGMRLYENGLRPWRSSFGWAKEYKHYDDPNHWHYDSGEANNTGDYIESALLLGRCGYDRYYDDAECFVRNGLLASQVLNTDWIVQSDEPDTRDTVYSNMRNRAHGAFVFTTPNGYQHYHTDLIGGALQSLSEVYQGLITIQDNLRVINMFFDGESSGLVLRSDLPAEGKITINASASGPVAIRIPSWVDRTKVSLTHQGAVTPPVWSENKLILENMGAGTKSVVTFPLQDKITTEKLPPFPEPFTIHWQGNFVTAIDPVPEKRIRLY